MSEHVTEETLRRAMSAEAEPRARLALLQHLGSCKECAAIGRSVADGEFAALTRHFADAAAEPPGHLDEYAQLRPYAAGRLDAAESEIVESHLEDCERCRARSKAIAVARRRRVWAYAIAASIAVAIGLAVLLTRPRGPEPKPPIVRRPQPPIEQPIEQPPQQSTTIAATEIDPEWQRLVARAVETRALPFPAVLATLNVPGDTPRGEGTGTERIRPAGVVVGEARPRFSWPAAKGVTSVVLVFDGERKVSQSVPLRANAWMPAKDLPRGRTLAWQVELRRDDDTITILPSPTAPPALFRIITEDEEREIARAKTDHSDDPLLLAVLYARSGLREEALTHLRLAAKQGTAGAEAILKNLDDE